MPRPRKGVTIENVLEVDRYFHFALKDNRLFSEIAPKNRELHMSAREAYKKLPQIDWRSAERQKTTIELRQKALQNWVQEYVSLEQWQRCLLTLRQKKSRKKLKLRRLDLQLPVYLTIKALAEKEGLTIGETIYKLAKPALDKRYRAELKQAFKIISIKKVR